MEFEISNTVILKSGGPGMLIEKIIDDNKVQCVWLDMYGNIQRSNFFTTMLKLIQPNNTVLIQKNISNSIDSTLLLGHKLSNIIPKV